MLLASFFSGFLPYIAIVLLFASLWYYIFVHKPFANFPYWRLEFRIPYWVLTGQKLDIVLLQKGIEQAKKYKSEGLFVAWIFKPRVVVFGEEIMKNIIPHTAVKPPVFRIAEFSFGEGIFISNGERWKKQKKMVVQALHTKALRSYATFMNNSAKILVKRLTDMKGSTDFDICEVMSQCTLNILYESNFGVTDGDKERVEKTVEIIHKTTEFFVYRFLRPWTHFDIWLPFSAYARQIMKLDVENRRRLEQVLTKIKESVEARNQSEVVEEECEVLSNKPKTIGENIIEDHLKTPIFTMEELAKEVYFLIFAGFDTAAHALVWTFYSLGLHQEIQNKVYDEIAALDKEDLQYADVQDLIYLESVIKETLRKFTIPGLLRKTTSDVQCGKYFIPKDTEVIPFLYMIHRDENVFPDPEKFDPERFLDKNSQIKPWNHLPFMEGPRTCLGRNYAMLSMKIILVQILRKFRVISLDKEEDLTFKVALILCAEKKPRMKFVPRHEHLSSKDL